MVLCAFLIARVPFPFGVSGSSLVSAPGHLLFISSPEQSSRRAIVLPPASELALALASASTNVKSFTFKFLGPHYFQTL